MKTIPSLAVLLGSAVILTAGDYGSQSGETYESVAPNRRFSVQAHQEKGYYKFAVELIELPSRKPVLSFDPKARFIGAAWSSDSRLVAIEQNRSTHDSAVSVFTIARKEDREIALPKECNDESATAFEPATRKRARKANSLKFHLASEGLQIVKWLSPDELVLSAEGRGWWGGDQADDKDTRFVAEYEIHIRFEPDCKTTLRTVALKAYDEL